MSKFGYSYPPGAENDPLAPYNEVDEMCVVCGNDLAYCQCTKCPKCGEIGNPKCNINRPSKRGVA